MPLDRPIPGRGSKRSKQDPRASWSTKRNEDPARPALLVHSFSAAIFLGRHAPKSWLPFPNPHRDRVVHPYWSRSTMGAESFTKSARLDGLGEEALHSHRWQTGAIRDLKTPFAWGWTQRANIQIPTDCVSSKVHLCS